MSKEIPQQSDKLQGKENKVSKLFYKYGLTRRPYILIGAVGTGRTVREVIKDSSVEDTLLTAATFVGLMAVIEIIHRGAGKKWPPLENNQTTKERKDSNS